MAQDYWTHSEQVRVKSSLPSSVLILAMFLFDLFFLLWVQREVHDQGGGLLIFLNRSHATRSLLSRHQRAQHRAPARVGDAARGWRPSLKSDRSFAWKGLCSLGVQRTWKERGKTTQGMINKRAPKCPSVNGKLKRKENTTSCSYRLMHSISRAAPYSKILFSPYLLWKDSLVCNGTRVMNACQLKGFSLLLPSVLHCCTSAGQVCIWWTSGRGEREKGRKTLPTRKKNGKRKGPRGWQVSQSAWHRAGVQWGRKGETRDGEKVKTLQKGLRVWTWLSLKVASLQNWNFEAGVLTDFHIYKLLVIADSTF